MEISGPQQPNTDVQQSSADSTISYGHIIGTKSYRNWDIIHKSLSAVFAIFIYSYYFSLYPVATYHKYLTILGMLITMLSRSYAVLHVFLKVNDQSLWTSFLNAVQSFHFATEGTIFVFYWGALAITDIPKRTTFEEHFINILIHVVCFLLALVPVLIERTNFHQKFYFLMALPFFLGYGLFLTAYTVGTGTYIYSVLDFTSALTAAYLIAALLLNHGAFFAGAALSACADRRWHRIHPDMPPSPPYRYFCCSIGGKGKSDKSQTVPKNKVQGAASSDGMAVHSVVNVIPATNIESSATNGRPIKAKMYSQAQPRHQI